MDYINYVDLGRFVGQILLLFKKMVYLVHLLINICSVQGSVGWVVKVLGY